jgi:hypothetical protein
MSVSAHGDRKHCSSITTARQKKHHFHLTKRVRDPSDTTYCARAIDDAQSRTISGAARAQHRAMFDKCSKQRFHKDFCDVVIYVARSFQIAARPAGAAARPSRRRPESMESSLKKILEN